VKGEGFMKKLTVTLIVLAAILVLANLAFARSTPEQAQTLVQEAAAFYQANGKDATLKELNNPQGKFVKDDLYVFAYALSDGANVAHPHNPKLIGKNFIDVPDPDGKLFRKEILNQAKTQGAGWVDYKYLNPASKQVESKTTYSEKVGEIILSCGVYKD
jgi:signal transduction histidine kinase